MPSPIESIWSLHKTACLCWSCKQNKSTWGCWLHKRWPWDLNKSGPLYPSNSLWLSCANALEYLRTLLGKLRSSHLPLVLFCELRLSTHERRLTGREHLQQILAQNQSKFLSRDTFAYFGFWTLSDMCPFLFFTAPGSSSFSQPIKLTQAIILKMGRLSQSADARAARL